MRFMGSKGEADWIMGKREGMHRKEAVRVREKESDTVVQHKGQAKASQRRC